MKAENLYLFITRRLYLFFYLLKKHFFRMLFSSLGLLISLVLIFSILGILRPIKKFIADQFEKSLPVDTVLVKPKEVLSQTGSLLGMLRRKQDFQLGLSENFVRELEKWPEVKSVKKTQILQRGVTGKFDHPVLSRMGITFNMLIQGVDRSLVERNLKCMKDFKNDYEVNEEGEKVTLVPLVLPDSFADMAYAYSVMNGLPAITKKEMTGLRIILDIDDVGARGRPGAGGGNFTGVVCGFASQNIVAVAGAPLDWVKNMHLGSGQKKASGSYDKALLEIRDMTMLDSFLEKISARNVRVETGSNVQVGKITRWLDTLDILLWTFVAVLLFISAISLSNSFMILTTQKKFEFGLYLVFGASPIFLWFLIFLEGAFWGAFHSSLAFFIAQNFSDFLQEVLRILPWFSELKEGKVVFDFYITFTEKWYLITGSILFSGLSSLLPAMYMTGRKTLSLIKKD